MKVLIVCNQIPYPPYVGSNVRIFNIIKHIAPSVEVSILCKSDEKLLGNAKELKKYCQKIEIIPVRTDRSLSQKIVRLFKPSEWRRTIVRLKMLFQGTPLAVLREYSTEFSEALKALVTCQYFDVIQFEFLETGLYMMEIRELFKKTGNSRAMFGKLVLVEHDITSVMIERIRKHAPWSQKIFLAIEFLFLKKIEKKLLNYFDHIIAMSELDRSKLKQLFPNLSDIDVIKSGVDTRMFKPSSTTDDKPCLLFLGSMKFVPNRDGLSWFLEKIFPTIVKMKPEVTLEVIGKEDEELVKRYKSERIIFHGIVENLETVIRRGRVFVCPLRMGAGTKLKIVTAMAFGLPVISTSIGVEGIMANKKEGVLVVDDEKEFANTVVEVLKNREKLKQLGENARLFSEREYSWDRICQDHIELYKKIISTDGRCDVYESFGDNIESFSTVGSLK